MKPVKKRKKYVGGGIVDDRSPRRREMDRQKQANRIKELEGMIAEKKGTPAAKVLVEEYRDLTRTRR